MSNQGKSAVPARFTDDELARLLKLAAKDGRTFEEVEYALFTMRAWARGNNRRRSDWVMTAVNAMRQGWALKGFKLWWERKPRSGLTYPGRPITADGIRQVLELRDRQRQQEG